MIWFALENTDSISTNSIGSVGNSGLITRLTRKCFCLANGITAVHLVNKSFLGFRGFIEMTSRPCSQSLALASSFHHIAWLSFDPRHKALDTRVSQQGLNRVQLFGQFRLGKQRMNLAVTDPVQVLRMSATLGLWNQMMGVALAVRDHPVAQRANQLRLNKRRPFLLK